MGPEAHSNETAVPTVRWTARKDLDSARELKRIEVTGAGDEEE
jgi:hypothetical protein